MRTRIARTRTVALVVVILFATIAGTLPVESFVSDDEGSRAATLSGAWREAARQRGWESRPYAKRSRFAGLARDLRWLAQPLGVAGPPLEPGGVTVVAGARRLARASADIDAASVLEDGSVVAFLSPEWGESRWVRLTPVPPETGHRMRWRCTSNADPELRAGSRCEAP